MENVVYVSKCSVMVFNPKKGVPVADYTLANIQLEIVDELNTVMELRSTNSRIIPYYRCAYLSYIKTVLCCIRPAINRIMFYCISLYICLFISV